VPAAAADAVVELPPPATAVVVGALPALITTGVELAVSSVGELSMGEVSVEVGAAALDESPLPLSEQPPPKQLHPRSRLSSQVQPGAQYQFVSTPEQGTLGPAGLGHVFDDTYGNNIVSVGFGPPGT
jgi:hypothetical protein